MDDTGTEQVLPWVVIGDTLSFTAAHAATYKIVTADLSFDDVAQDAWYQDAVAFTCVRGLFSGISERQFAPDDTMSRAMLVTVLHRLAMCDVEKADFPLSDPVFFVDVAPDTWYGQSVLWAGRAGLISGVGQGRFEPDGEISREQLAVVLYQFAKAPAVPKENLAFDDADLISDWAKDAVLWATKTGLLSGRDNNLLDPTGQATRAEVAAILMRFIHLI